MTLCIKNRYVIISGPLSHYSTWDTFRVAAWSPPGEIVGVIPIEDQLRLILCGCSSEVIVISIVYLRFSFLYCWDTWGPGGRVVHTRYRAPWDPETTWSGEFDLKKNLEWRTSRGRTRSSWAALRPRGPTLRTLCLYGAANRACTDSACRKEREVERHTRETGVGESASKIWRTRFAGGRGSYFGRLKSLLESCFGGK
jgi:hypothetical protein